MKNESKVDIPEGLQLDSNTNKLARFFPTEKIKNIRIPLPEHLANVTSPSLVDTMIDVLNYRGILTANLGTLDITFESAYGKEIEKQGTNKATLDENGCHLSFSKILGNASFKYKYGFFTIGIILIDKYRDRTSGHAIAGYVDNAQKTIWIYHGNHATAYEEIDIVLRQYFHNNLPGYQVEMIHRNDQLAYGTCAMFHPAVVYLMLLHGRDSILKFLDGLFDSNLFCTSFHIENVIDNAVIDLFNYHDSIFKAATPQQQHPNPKCYNDIIAISDSQKYTPGFRDMLKKHAAIILTIINDKKWMTLDDLAQLTPRKLRQLCEDFSNIDTLVSGFKVLPIEIYRGIDDFPQDIIDNASIVGKMIRDYRWINSISEPLTYTESERRNIYQAQSQQQINDIFSQLLIKSSKRWCKPCQSPTENPTTLQILEPRIFVTLSDDFSTRKNQETVSPNKREMTRITHTRKSLLTEGIKESIKKMEEGMQQSCNMVAATLGPQDSENSTATNRVKYSY